MWPALLWATGVTGVLGLLAWLIDPAAGGLAAFVVTTLWVHGPVSPFLPAAYEPVLMHYGTLYPALVVAGVGTAANLVVEAVNYGLYERVLNSTSLARLTETRLARWALELFQRAPFLAIWIGTWSPIPDWTIRLLAPMSRYPLGRYLVAMGLGRFPRYWLFAEIGRRVGVPGPWLAATLTLSLVVGLLAAWHHRATRVGAHPDLAVRATA
jgi:membrane protein YqaA with SNARE-associated domain